MLKNLVYFGSPEFSADILETLIASNLINIAGVVTAPDKPVGRKQVITESPVSKFAGSLDLPTYKPERLDDNNLAHIKLLKPDIFLVVSYGKIIPENWLNVPTIGTFNIHFSLLPKYRGALCISEAIKNQDTETGVTLMEMEKGLDSGPIISQTKVAIDEDDNVATLTTKLTQAAKEILIRNLPEICAQTYTSTPQVETLATYTKSHRSVNRDSAFIPWDKIQSCLPAIKSRNCSELHALIRSLNPEPGAWSKLPEGTEFKIIKTKLVNEKLTIETIQIPGKNPISWKQFLGGHPLSV